MSLAPKSLRTRPDPFFLGPASSQGCVVTIYNAIQYPERKTAAQAAPSTKLQWSCLCRDDIAFSGSAVTAREMPGTTGPDLNGNHEAVELQRLLLPLKGS